MLLKPPPPMLERAAGAAGLGGAEGVGWERLKALVE
jgi:hypothetical protein